MTTWRVVTGAKRNIASRSKVVAVASVFTLLLAAPWARSSSVDHQPATGLSSARPEASPSPAPLSKKPRAFAPPELARALDRSTQFESFAQPTATPEPPPRLSIQKDAPRSALPFWRNRPKLMEKVRQDREVIVSVKQEPVKGKDLTRFTILGVGMVARPKDFSFTVAQDYPRLKEVSDHFKTVTYDERQRQLFVITEALGYQARMIMKLTPVSEDWRSEIQWEVVWGHFRGMKGLMGFERIDSGRTEVSITGELEAKELPLPRILMGFALEIIAQKVAEKMRTHIEAQPLTSPAKVSAQ